MTAPLGMSPAPGAVPAAVPALAPLRPGDRVGLVATSGPPVPAMLERSVALLESWGLVPVPGKNLRATHPRAAYLAGGDAQRAADLQDAWCDPTLSAVFVIRGGYGAVRLLDLLDVDKLRAAAPKPLFGSSDVTGIHEFWAERLDMPSWFTPMLATGALLDDPAAAASLKQAVFEPYAGRRYTADAAGTLVPGTARGLLTGGNLSLLAMTLGARGRPPLDNAGRIGLLEDVTEAPYKIDGMLHSLLRAAGSTGWPGSPWAPGRTAGIWPRSRTSASSCSPRWGSRSSGNSVSATARRRTAFRSGSPPRCTRPRPAGPAWCSADGPARPAARRAPAPPRLRSEGRHHAVGGLRRRGRRPTAAGRYGR